MHPLRHPYLATAHIWLNLPVPTYPQIALVLDLGAHHLDLMFSDPRNPPCFAAAREVEARMIRQWCQEAYDNLGLL